VAIIGFIYVVGLYWPKYEEYFFELALLGGNGTAEGFFLDENSTINIGSRMRWQLYVHNHMGREQDLTIKVKLLNSTMRAPDDREHDPSPAPVFLEYPLTLLKDETIIIPFSWNIARAEPQNGTLIKGLIVNDNLIDVSIRDSNYRFRIVFELWVYDETSDLYQFGWYSKDEFYSASIYMWFNARE